MGELHIRAHGEKGVMLHPRALGHYIDRRLGTGLSFTLATLALGLTIAGYALWRQANDLEHS